jgi:predicted transcriptional regulator
MNRVTVGVSSASETKKRMRRALHGEEEGAFIAFASPDLLRKVLTPKR